jgi:hypothetical protein
MSQVITQFKRVRVFKCENACGAEITTTDRCTKYCKPCAAARKKYRSRTGKVAPIGYGVAV